MPDGEAQQARDQIFLSQLGKDSISGPFPSRWTCPEIQPWLYGYDAHEEVEAAVKKQPLQSPTSVTKATTVPTHKDNKS